MGRAPTGNAGYVVAFSGGADSLALLASLVALPGPPVEAVVIDHGLRPGSAGEAERALALARSLGVEARVVKVHVAGKGGLEAAARRARYKALAMAATGRPILTGHTADDQAETLLLRLGRGAGLRGAGGIHFETSIEGAHLIRPLLEVRRSEILAAVRALGLSPVEDPTNHTDDFSRNVVRHRILPLLESIAPGATESLARFASFAEEDEGYLGAEAARIRAGRPSLEVEELLSLPPALGKRVIRDLVEQSGPSPSHRRIAEVLALATGRGGQLHLAGGVVVTVAKGILSVARGPTGRRPSAAMSSGAEGPGSGLQGAGMVAGPGAGEVLLAPGEERSFAGVSFRLDGVPPPHVGAGVWIPSSYHPPYRLRLVRRGEKVEVPGVGRRKVSDLLGEHRIPWERRWQTVLVEALDGRPIWLVGVRPLCPKPDPGETAFHLRTSEGKDA